MGASKAITKDRTRETVIRLRIIANLDHLFGAASSPKQLINSPSQDYQQIQPCLVPVLWVGLEAHVREKNPHLHYKIIWNFR